MRRDRRARRLGRGWRGRKQQRADERKEVLMGRGEGDEVRGDDGGLALPCLAPARGARWEEGAGVEQGLVGRRGEGGGRIEVEEKEKEFDDELPRGDLSGFLVRVEQRDELHEGRWAGAPQSEAANG